MPDASNPSPSPSLLNDVQTGVVRAVKAQLAAYLFFHITDPRKFAEQLPDGTDSVTGLGLTAARFRSEAWRTGNRQPAASNAVTPLANIAFTYSGLRTLGVHKDTLATFPEVFREGMAQRAELLGDTGPADPERWDGSLGSSAVHGVVWMTLHCTVARPAADLVKAYEQLHEAVSRIAGAVVPPLPNWPSSVRSKGSSQPALGFAPQPIRGAEIVHVEFGLANYAPGPGGEPEFPVEHFGFRDGISQPFADVGLPPPAPGGGTPRAGDSWAPVARGELLLGYPDEQDSVQPLPVNRKLRENGTYMVFRKLEQDVVGFRNFVAKHDAGGTGKLAAQMIGRWPDGTPLVQHPDGPQSDQSAPSKRTLNDFRYQAEDPEGLRCPIGAHIRRANPRDTNDRDEARRHRLFRRGISYGGLPLDAGSPGDGNRRGMLFVSLQARIDRQFEIVQSHWLNRSELYGQAGLRADPLVGAHAGRPQDAFQPAGRPGPVTGLPRFVTLRGGDYFFVPSFTALAGMKGGDDFAIDDQTAPLPQPALGLSVPRRAADTSAELVATGIKLLAPGAPAFVERPPVTTTLFPGGPPITTKTIVVGRHDLAMAVLKDDDHFSNAPFDQTSRAILDGQQLLIGLPKGPERTKRLAVLHEALRAMGPLAVDATAKRLVRQVLDRVGPLGRLDVVEDVGRVVPILATGELFGVRGPAFVSPTAIAAHFARLDVTDMPDDWLRTLPPINDHDKPLITMQAWTRMTFLQIFVNTVGAKELIAPAERAARELMRQIDDLLFAARSRASTTAKPRNLLEALARLPVDLTDAPDPHRHARLLLAEFTAGTVETLNTALCHVIDYVLDHRHALSQTLCGLLQTGPAVLRESIGRLSDEQVDRLIYEILRFDPMGALAFRTCAAPGATIDGLPVDPGTIVCVVAASAMVDEVAFPDAMTIRFDRPLERYLHFGAGMHACAGNTITTPFVFPIAMPLLREMFRAIATRPQLRRAAGESGKRQTTFPLLVDGLTVRFEPTA